MRRAAAGRGIAGDVRDPVREHGFHDEVAESDWSPERRRFAEQVRLLTRALRSEDEGVREVAIVQLTLFGPKVVPHLTSALEAALDESDLRQTSHQSTAPTERAVAGICGALGIIGASDAAVDLAAALPRKEAVEALARIGGGRALDLVMRTIEDGTPSWASSADADPAFVRRVFLLFGEAGRRRLQEELAAGSKSTRAVVEEILRIMGY